MKACGQRVWCTPDFSQVSAQSRSPLRRSRGCRRDRSPPGHSGLTHEGVPPRSSFVERDRWTRKVEELIPRKSPISSAEYPSTSCSSIQSVLRLQRPDSGCNCQRCLAVCPRPRRLHRGDVTFERSRDSQICCGSPVIENQVSAECVNPAAQISAPKFRELAHTRTKMS